MAASQAAGSVCGTNVVLMPVRARMFENSCTVAPNRPLEATMWSPFFRCARQTAMIAAMPLAIATQSSAPSSAARRSSNMVTVGLVKRE